MGKLKQIDITDLSDYTLRNILDLNMYDTDTVIIKTREFNELHIKQRLKEMWNVLKEVGNILWEDVDLYEEEYQLWDKTKKFWIDVKFDKEGMYESVKCTQDDIYKVIAFLYEIHSWEGDPEEAVYEFITDKTNQVRNFRELVTNVDFTRYFNPDLNIEFEYIS